MRWFASRSLPALVSVLLTATGAAGLAAASIFRYDRFGANAYDLGIYDQSIWAYSRLQPTLDNTVLRTPNALGNHFQPILVLLAPVDWVWQDARGILVAQGVLLALASLPIYLWARERLGAMAALLFQLAYLVFWGVLGGNLYDFHEVALAAPIVSLSLYALLTHRTRLLWATVVLGLVTKENLALTFAALGVYALVVQRRSRLGLSVVAVSVAWFAIVLKAILPWATGAPYAHWFYPALGAGPGSALLHLVEHPLGTIRLFITPHAKQVALFDLFAAWLLLPLVSPLLIVMLPTLGERFLADRPEYWAQGFHYSLVVAPMLAFAAIDTTACVARLFAGRTRIAIPVVLAAGALVAGLAFSFARLRPLDELGRYTSAAHAAEIRSCLRTIPSGSSVAATSALVPHLSQRRRIWVLDDRPVPRARFYALDAYTWTYPFSNADIAALVRRSLGRGYGVRCSKSGTAVLERGVPRGRLSPELTRLLHL